MSNIKFFVVTVDSGVSIGTYLGCINLNTGSVNGYMYIDDMIYGRGIDVIKEFHYHNVDEFVLAVEHCWGDDVLFSYDDNEISETFMYIENIIK